MHSEGNRSMTKTVAGSPKRKRALAKAETLPDVEPPKPDDAQNEQRKPRAQKNIKLFTDLWIMRHVKPPKTGQELYWDAGCRGLALLVGLRTKTFRSMYKLNGEWKTRTLGRFGEVVLDDGADNPNVSWAREQTR